MAFALVIQIFGWYCPLTDLEVWLRQKEAPGLSYRGSFIIHYVEKMIYVEISPGVIFAATVLLCIFNSWMYMRKKIVG